MLSTAFYLDALNPFSPSTSAEQTACLGLVNAKGILDDCVYPESFHSGFELDLATDENLREHPQTTPLRVRALLPRPPASRSPCSAPRGHQLEPKGGAQARSPRGARAAARFSSARPTTFPRQRGMGVRGVTGVPSEAGLEFTYSSLF